MSMFMDYLKETVGDRLDLGVFAREVTDTVVQKTAQGSAEISHALFSQGNSFVPYGAGQSAVEVEGPQQSYQDQLRDASRSAEREQDQGMDR